MTLLYNLANFLHSDYISYLAFLNNISKQCPSFSDWDFAQLFSILTSEFKSEITSPDDLLNKIRNSAIVPKPICEELFYIWEWREFVKPNLSESRLKNHSFLHSFMVKKEGNVGVLRGRKYPQDTSEWKPDDGIKLLRDGVEFTLIGCAELLST